MEGKGVRVPLGTVVMVVILLGLNLAQTQVEATSCCPSTSARLIYNACRVAALSRKNCAALSGCKILENVTACTVPPYIHLTHCKFGCASSMCSTFSTLEISDAVEEEMVACNNKCSELCNEGYYEGSNAVLTA